MITQLRKIRKSSKEGERGLSLYYTCIITILYTPIIPLSYPYCTYITLKLNLHYTYINYRAENESKQLHQVITQLRQVRKSSKEGEEGITVERNNLKIEVKNLTGMYMYFFSCFMYIY
jgi:hypothetical protein